MSETERKPLNLLGSFFPDNRYLPQKGEFHYRHRQQLSPLDYRALTEGEIEILTKNGNRSSDWSQVSVADPFDPTLIVGSQFVGMVRLGSFEASLLEHNDLALPVGIYNSFIISSDIGSNCAIHSLRYLSFYILGDQVIIHNVDEMIATNHAKFGEGAVKEGEREEVRIWIELMNENGGRKVIPFNGMVPADAWLWAQNRDDSQLMEQYQKLAERSFNRERGWYGTVGEKSVIKSTRILKDVKVGDYAYIKGANKLKNLTINSSYKAPSQIGEGVELVNGLVGFGCHIFYGVKAIRFILCDNSHLKYGARLINSVLGQNSTISCCEVLNSLIFPGHEQHHNSSFLCSSLLLGQTNIASNVTIGSNHNSRANDGEIVAGRGFWPGLSTSLKHNSRFASFTLLVKGSYPSEIDNPLPFSLLSLSKEGLVLYPAYWLLHNMYALARNRQKYEARDRRVVKEQSLEFNYLAPDTVGEMVNAMETLSHWAKECSLFESESDLSKEAFFKNSKRLRLKVYGIENSKKATTVLNVGLGYFAYYEMALYYSVKSLVDHAAKEGVSVKTLLESLKVEKAEKWENCGGQLVPKWRVEALKREIKDGTLKTWEQVHYRYREWEEQCAEDTALFAAATLREITGINNFEKQQLLLYLDRAAEIWRSIEKRSTDSRQKDYSNQFRNMVYSSERERDAVLGCFDDNQFLKEMANRGKSVLTSIEAAKREL